MGPSDEVATVALAAPSDGSADNPVPSVALVVASQDHVATVQIGSSATVVGGFHTSMGRANR